MTLLYEDACFLSHETGTHPERAERVREISKMLAMSGLRDLCARPTWEPISVDRLALVHAPGYVDHVRTFSQQGGGRIEVDTLASKASYTVARQATGAAVDATLRVVGGEDSTAMCLVRPPGHHALRAAAMGFCLFNHAAIAARVATRELELDRVLIIDWDVHHGNGTQDAFWDDEQIGFFSIHRWPFYPGTGSDDETGGGAAVGTIANLPVTFGTRRDEYLTLFRSELERFANHIQPQLVILSAGFDAHRADPVGSLGLESEDYIRMTQVVQQVAAAHAGGKLVSILEGGYNPPVLADCVELHLREMIDAEERPRCKGV